MKGEQKKAIEVILEIDCLELRVTISYTVHPSHQFRFARPFDSRPEEISPASW